MCPPSATGPASGPAPAYRHRLPSPPPVSGEHEPHPPPAPPRAVGARWCAWTSNGTVHSESLSLVPHPQDNEPFRPRARRSMFPRLCRGPPRNRSASASWRCWRSVSRTRASWQAEFAAGCRPSAPSSMPLVLRGALNCAQWCTASFQQDLYLPFPRGALGSHSLRSAGLVAVDTSPAVSRLVAALPPALYFRAPARGRPPVRGWQRLLLHVVFGEPSAQGLGPTLSRAHQPLDRRAPHLRFSWITPGRSTDLLNLERPTGWCGCLG